MDDLNLQNVPTKPIVRLLHDHQAGQPVGVANRFRQATHTFYVENPAQVPVQIQSSPDGEVWFNVFPESTLPAFTVHVTLNCMYMRVVRGVEPGTVNAWVVSGGITRE